MSFSEKYKKIYSVVEEDVEKVKKQVLSELKNSDGIKNELSELFNSPSKHIRAVLSFLYLKANNIDITDKQIRYQTISELIHNGSLIHDDVIDNSEIRRNKKTLNCSCGNHLSVVAGDLVLAFALKELADLNSYEHTSLIAKTIAKMCEGEINQNNSKFKIPTMEEYLDKTYNKTGTLFEAAISGAVMLSDKNCPGNAAGFGKNFGTAFQIRDDIKNIEDNLPDSDIKNGIYTASVIYSQNPDDPSPGIEKAKDLLNNYIQEAKTDLNNIPENEYKSAIINLLELINHE